jgi:hypothetical protein
VRYGEVQTKIMSCSCCFAGKLKHLQCIPKTKTATVCEVTSCEERISYTFEAGICHGSLDQPQKNCRHSRPLDSGPKTRRRGCRCRTRLSEAEMGRMSGSTTNCSVQLVQISPPMKLSGYTDGLSWPLITWWTNGEIGSCMTLRSLV